MATIHQSRILPYPSSTGSNSPIAFAPLRSLMSKKIPGAQTGRCHLKKNKRPCGAWINAAGILQ